MYLKSLYLNNFRLFEEAYVEFCPEVNWISGQNAMGKTTLLEAIYLLSTGTSFRSHQLSNLIRHGASHFYLEAHFVKHEISQRLRLSYSKAERRIYINNSCYPSLSALYGVLFSIAYSPEDICLINGAPQERRRLIDTQLGQIDPLYLHHLSRYQRAMRQRNYLLKAKNVLSIESWEYEMATSAAYIVQKRLPLIETLQKHAAPIHRLIAGHQPDLTLSYRPFGRLDGSGWHEQALRQHYLEQYQKHRPREIALASTLVGPHKDDISITIGEKDARFFASEGQQRSCAASLRLAQWQQLQQASELAPLMLIDDFGVSLDAMRCQRLLEQLNSCSQLFLTSTMPLPDSLKSKPHKMIEIPAVT